MVSVKNKNHANDPRNIPDTKIRLVQILLSLKQNVEKIAIKTNMVIGLESVSKKAVIQDDITFLVFGRDGISLEKRKSARTPQAHNKIPPNNLIQNRCPVRQSDMAEKPRAATQA